MSIVSSSKKKDLAKEFIKYMASAEGQVRSAMMPAYNASIPSMAGWRMLNEKYPADAKRLRMETGAHNVMDEYKAGKIHIRHTPVQQEIEVWNEAWTQFKTA
jgi:spermidine/putrescine transport system substrate-binding protein